MKELFPLFLFFHLIFPCYAQENEKPILEVEWVIDPYNSQDALAHWDYVLLRAMYEGEIKAYDSCWEEVDNCYLERAVPLKMRRAYLTMSECEILAANGSFFVDEIETFYTEAELIKLYKEGKSLKELIKLKYYEPYETYSCNLGIVETVHFDSSLNEQAGKVHTIRLFITKEFSEIGQQEMLCQFKYEDVKRLGLYGQNIIDKHAYKIFIRRLENLTITNGRNICQLLPLKNPINGQLQKARIENSIFSYFAENIIFDEDEDFLIGPKQW